MWSEGMLEVAKETARFLAWADVAGHGSLPTGVLTPHLPPL